MAHPLVAQFVSTSAVHHADGKHREPLSQRACVHRQDPFLFPCHPHHIPRSRLAKQVSTLASRRFFPRVVSASSENSRSRCRCRPTGTCSILTYPWLNLLIPHPSSIRIPELSHLSILASAFERLGNSSPIRLCKAALLVTEEDIASSLQEYILPPQPIRELRALTRSRKTVAQERAQKINRLQKGLETANLTLASVARDVLGKSGRDRLDALSAGQRDTQVLAELARGRFRATIPDRRLAWDGRLPPHQSLLLQQILVQSDFLDASIEQGEGEIQQRLISLKEEVGVLERVPVVLQGGAAVVIAQIGIERSRFPTARASGPPLRESAQARKSAEASGSAARPRKTIALCARSCANGPGSWRASKNSTISRLRPIVLPNDEARSALPWLWLTAFS